MSEAYELPTCERCGVEYALREGQEPTPYCDECSHVMIEELKQRHREDVARLMAKSELIGKLEREIAQRDATIKAVRERCESALGYPWTITAQTVGNILALLDKEQAC